MPRESSKPAGPRGLSQLRKYLKRMGWQFLATENSSLRGLSGGNGVQWQWSARSNTDGRLLLFYAYCPVFVRPEKRVVVAEYLTRANWGLYFGNFEMDWSDGQVCFRTSVPLGPAGPPEQTLEKLVWSNCSLMERYLPGLMAVALGNINPEQAVMEAERDLQAKPATEPPSDTDAPPAQSQSNNGPASQEPWHERFSASDN